MMNKQPKINVSQFLRQYESSGTRRVYLTGLKQFFELNYPELKIELETQRKERDERFLSSNIVIENLDKYSEKYFAEERNHREDILNFKESLKALSPKGKNLRLSTIRAFFNDNEITLPKRLFKNLNGKSVESLTWEKIPDNDELRRIVEYLPVQGKALALVLSSSGVRIGESVKLKLSDIDFDQEPVRIRMRADVTKNKRRRITFISPEAKLAIEEWKQYRAQYIERAQNRTQKGFKKDKKDLLFPFTEQNFGYMWRNALEKAKLLTRDVTTNRVTMRPHNLRKFFRLRVGRYGQDESECLLGHQQGLNSIYANFQDAEERLREVYVKSIPDLSVYDRSITVTQVDEETKEKISKLEHQVDILTKDYVVKEAEIKLISIQLANTNQQLINTESAFNITVDKLINRVENLEHTLEDVLKTPVKDNLFKSQ